MPWPARTLLVISHAALLAAGYAAYAGFHQPATAPATSPETGATAMKTVRPRDTPSDAEVRAIVQSVLPQSVPLAADPLNLRGSYAKFKEEARRMIHELPAVDDPAAELEREMAAHPPSADDPAWQPSPRAAALLYQLLMKDPAAVEKLMSNPFDKRLATVMPASEVAVDEMVKAPGGLDKLLGSGALTSGSPLDRYLASSFATGQDAALMAQARDALPPARWSQMCEAMADYWPDGQRGEMLKFAIAQNQPRMILVVASQIGGFSDASSPEAGAWLSGVLADPSLPAEFRQALVADRNVGRIMAADSSAPLALRMEFAEGATPQEKYATLWGNVLAHAWDDGPDWEGLVRSGGATAQQVLDTIAKENPELAAAAPQELRTRLCAALAGQNSTEALKLLDGLSEDERNQAILQATRGSIVDAAPDTFLSFISQASADSPALWEERLDAWNSGMSSFLRNTGSEEVTAWVRNLPTGTDREMALYALSRAQQQWNGELAAQLSGQVTDPKLQQRLAEKR